MIINEILFHKCTSLNKYKMLLEFFCYVLVAHTAFRPKTKTLVSNHCVALLIGVAVLISCLNINLQ